MTGSILPGTSDNPLGGDSALSWDRIIEAVGPASLLVVIERRMSDGLKRQYSPTDILQEALLRAWRSRDQLAWRGLREFRAWLLTIVDHCIRDGADYLSAQKRTGGGPLFSLSGTPTHADRSSGSIYAGPVATTTPSRVAIHAEQAQAMREALEGVAEDLRAVVHLRLFEQRTMAEIAEALGITVAAVRHRFHKGLETYRRRLLSALSGRSGVQSLISEEFASAGDAPAASV